MMVLKLYGSMKPESKCTQRVLIILKEKNVPFEVHHIDSAKGEHKTPEYLVKQPFGQFPCIVSYLSTTFSGDADCESRTTMASFFLKAARLLLISL